MLTHLNATGLDQSRSPYSKSHERRLKRKAREQVAGGLKDITDALAEVETDIPVAIQQTVSLSDGVAPEDTGGKPKSTPGLIGKGKHAPLSKSQRKKALSASHLRVLCWNGTHALFPLLDKLNVCAFLSYCRHPSSLPTPSRPSARMPRTPLLNMKQNDEQLSICHLPLLYRDLYWIFCNSSSSSHDISVGT